MAKKETMEIAEIKGFEALAHLNSFNEALVEECQGMDFTFDRIKLPTGGGTAFEVPTIEDGESEMVKELVGVIVYNHPAYAYYANKYSGGSNPPDCGSFDGVDGVGNP